MWNLTKRFSLAALVVALGAAPAFGQYFGSPPYLGGGTIYSTPVPSYQPGYSPGYYPGYPPYGGYYDPFGGYFRGVGDLVSAYGQYQQDYQRARLLNQEVEREKLRTRQMLREQRAYEWANRLTAEDLKKERDALALRRSLNDPPLTEIINGDALNTLLKDIQKKQGQGVRGPNVPLDPDLLRQVNVTAGAGGNIALFRDGGRLTWPLPLQEPAFRANREEFQAKLYEAVKQAREGDLQAATVDALARALDGIDRTLREQVKGMGIGAVMEARGYLGDLRDGVQALRNPNVQNYFNDKWAAQGRDVGDLVKNMTDKGLRFAAAVDGGETAYRSLHQSMVNYSYALNQLARRPRN